MRTPQERLWNLPSGTLAVGAGLSAVGIASFLYLVVAGRVLGPERFGPLALFWMLLHTLGPGVFLPLEQELARRLSSRQADAQGSRAVVRQAATIACYMTLGLVLLVAVVGDILVQQFFNGSIGLLLALLASLVAIAGSYFARGVLAGLLAWRRYGLQLGVDGVCRLAAVALLAVLGIRTPAIYAVALVVALALSSLVTVIRPLKDLQAGPRVSWYELGGSLGWLLVGSVAALFLLNVAPLAVQVLAAPDEAEATGLFVAALVVARVPLLLFAAVQAALLPALARLAARGQRSDFIKILFGLMTAILILGFVLVGASALAGPEALALAFGEKFRVDRLALVLLTVTTVGFMLMTILSQSLIALRSHGQAAGASLAGAGAFLLSCSLLQGPTVLRVSTALTVAVLVTIVVLAERLTSRMRRWVDHVA